MKPTLIISHGSELVTELGLRLYERNMLSCLLDNKTKYLIMIFLTQKNMKKIGLWIPSRKNYKRQKGEEDAWFLKEISDNLISDLKREVNVNIIEISNFKDAIIKSGKVFVEDFCLNDLDVFFWCGKIRIGPGSYRLDLLKTIANNAKVINSPYSVEVCSDKFKTQTLLKNNGIRVMENLLLEYTYDKSSSHRAINNFFGKYKDVLLKPRYGGAGIGIVKTNNKQRLKEAIEYSGKKVHFIEQFIPHKIEDFIGINIINNKFIHGYTKSSDFIVDGWKPYSNKPGGMVLKQATTKQKKIALKVAKIVKLDFFGVDMITDKNGNIYVVDVNTFPGIYPEIISKLEIDAIGELVNCIKNKLK